MMRIRHIEKFGPLRIYLLMAGMAVAFLFLAGFLWRLQVAHVSQYENRQQIQSVRRVRLPGIRGKIYDRNGLCLADNCPAYSVALFLEEIRRPGPWVRTVDHAMNIMEQVSAVIELEPEINREQIKKHIRLRLPLPLVLWRDLTPRAMARLVEQGDKIPGVDIYTQTTRTYPYSPYTSHLLGYVGRADLNHMKDGNSYSYYLTEMTGRAGLEKLFNPFLRGEAGGALMQIDVSGYHHDELARRAPKAGGDLRLTLDIDVQLLAHKALENHRGAVVVLNPNNGDVLAIVSAPGYDANQFVPYITFKEWNQLCNDPNKPMLNRAVAGTYPPGSIFKPLVGLAAAMASPESVHQIYDSPSAFHVGNHIFHDWNRTGHGKLNMREALKRSANVYFFKTALQCGWKPIITQAHAIGLGAKTGLEVDYERAGLVPDVSWKRSTGRSGWSDGDTCNLAIGQGYLSVTPIQMAMMTAAIANGGYLYRPRIVQAHRLPENKNFVNEPLRRVGKMDWPEEALTVVRSGMRDVIMARDGTGQQAVVNGLDFAGKTGTAEYGAKGAGKKHTWMIAFVPFEQPQYAIAILIEDGESGGSTVGPRLKILVEGLYEKMKQEGVCS